MQDYAMMKARGLIHPHQKLKLHLGCGGTMMEGYINVDYPSSEHNLMQVCADYEADLAMMDMPESSVDEIRIHHVFEHFNRVVALGLLIRWHKWLKPGGELIIETPDFIGTSAAALESPVSDQIALVRHLEGDHTAAWGYHIGQWFPARFEKTLVALGYSDLEMTKVATPWHTPPLHNITVKCQKRVAHDTAVSLEAAEGLLRDSMVAQAEMPTWRIWCEQLRAFVDAFQLPHQPSFAAQSAPVASPPAAQPGAEAGEGQQQPVHALIDAMLSQIGAQPPIGDIQGFNQKDRDAWIASVAAQIPPGSSVLDVGAGSCPYREVFAHTGYKTHDFKKYEGYIDADRQEGTYGELDYISDIVALPILSGSFDVVMCTEVLEHVPEPIRAFGEMARVVRPGGLLILTAPLGSGLHQEPFHFYGGYTPHWYEMMAKRFGLIVEEISPNGTFFKNLAQECARVAWTLEQHKAGHGPHVEAVGQLFGELLPRYLFGLDAAYPNPAFTIGYHVKLRKPAG
jgi:2-polyprenyl-3-methyl-5-hydroxy-6-metoxy-1,4-benzoquinol methylase